MPDRPADQLRTVKITPGFMPQAEGSVLIECGLTRVICTASVLQSVPDFMAGKGTGWITAEYGMLPRSTGSRKKRPVSSSHQDGRSVEIQRLIGRSLRQVADLNYLGERTIAIDCDVINADGGTRTAAITGATVALIEALDWMVRKEMIPGIPLRHWVAAVSVGLCAGLPTLDLDYKLDSAADVDFNVVMTDDARFIETQGTAEREPFSREVLDELLALAKKGISELFGFQKAALGPDVLARIHGQT
ncbi:MAG: ribonuclease PH [Planctomycetota bacterium]